MDKVKYITVSEYSRLMGVHPNTVGTQLRMGKIKGMRVGKAWRVEVGADVDIPSVGEKATTQPASQPTILPANLPDTQPTELDKLDEEMADIEREEAVLDARQRVAEKKLQQQAGITWERFLELQKELEKRNEDLRAAKEQVEKEMVAVSEKEGVMDNLEASLKNAQSVMSTWWEDAGKYALDIVELVEKINEESTYDEGNAQAYRSTGGGSYDQGTHPPEKTLLTGDALKDRWYDVFKVLWKIARLPEPNFTIGEPTVEVEDTEDTEDSDQFNEQEPEELDLTPVEKAVDETVELVDAGEPDIAVPKKRVKN